jgi:hypothetical protein
MVLYWHNRCAIDGNYSRVVFPLSYCSIRILHVASTSEANTLLYCSTVLASTVLASTVLRVRTRFWYCTVATGTAELYRYNE